MIVCVVVVVVPLLGSVFLAILGLNSRTRQLLDLFRRDVLVASVVPRGQLRG